MNGKQIKSNKEFSKQLKAELEGMTVPKSLEKESIVKMLNENKNKEFSRAETKGTKQGGHIIYLRRLTAVAAMLIVVIGAALFMRADKGEQIIKTDSFYEGHEENAPIKNATSFEQVDQALREIILGKQTAESNIPSTDAEGSTKAKNENVTAGTKPDSVTTTRVLSDNYEGLLETAAPKDHKKINENILNGNSLLQAVANGVSDISRQATIVKSDEEFIYTVTSGNDENGKTVQKLIIFKAKPADKLKPVAEIIVSDGSQSNTTEIVTDIHIKGKTLIVVSESDTKKEGVTSSNALTTVVFFSISDISSPVKVREHVQDGRFISSKIYGTRLCVVTEASVSQDMLKEDGNINEKMIPAFRVNDKETRLKAENIFIAVNDPEASFLVITSTDISDFSAPVGRLAVLGGGNILCGSDSITVARGFVSVENGLDGSLTELYSISVGDSVNVCGSYVLEGLVFGGIDDGQKGYIRTVSSTGNAYNIYVLSKNLEYVSSLKGVFSGEKLRKTCFTGNKGFFTTGENGEKTQIVDFSNVKEPCVCGTIASKGCFGSFIGITDTLVACTDPCQGNSSGPITKIHLFDISNLKEPVAVSDFTLEGDVIYLPSGDICGSFTNSEEKLFGFPFIKNDPDGTHSVSYAVFIVEDKTIKQLGTFEHTKGETIASCVNGVYGEDVLYTVSGERMTAYSVKDGTKLASVKIK